jgi:hypothetical protein
MIPLRWYIDDQKSMDFATKTYFVSQEAMQNFLGVTLVPNPLTVSIAITDILYRAAKKKIRYGEVWGLARQAAQLAVEYGSYGEIIGWLKQFINRHKEMITNTELVRTQENPEIQVDDNKENEPEQIGNPLVSQRKGRPETKKHKSSTEKKPCARYTCKMCGQTGHNSARCQNR